MSHPIYKVNHLVNDEISAIYVFSGGTERTIFTEAEIENAETNKIPIIYSKQVIHMDDSIGVVKLKILHELLKTKDVSLEEMYLFCQTNETLHSDAIYSALTQNKRRARLTTVQLEQFVFNIISDSDGNTIEIPIKESSDYVFDDILKMGFDNKNRTFIVNKLLGQRKIVIENEFPFVVNPYYVDSYDELFEKTQRKSISSVNGQLLMNSGNILGNNIYLCLASDVLSDSKTETEKTIRTYYPFLYDKEILNTQLLTKARDDLIDSNKKILNQKALDTFETVNLFYDIYALKKSELR